ncbi:putative quinol monooxygenase [Aquisphaera insulae]|uniref:putative quinol monooxygenase n=1 Tax=Aquisphaera insulae TaxID=2712864 RepID=UPI00196B3A1A|nr:putative quinol monooxygenase [Aquisphaera insulae]
MGLDRRTILTTGATLAGAAMLGAEVQADGAKRPELPEGAVILTAAIKARADEVEAVKEALLSLVEPTRKEAGCICYNLHQSKSEPTEFVFYEIWSSQADLDAHGKAPHMKALGAKLKDRTVKGGGVTFFKLLG